MPSGVGIVMGWQDQMVFACRKNLFFINSMSALLIREEWMRHKSRRNSKSSLAVRDPLSSFQGLKSCLLMLKMRVLFNDLIVWKGHRPLWACGFRHLIKNYYEKTLDSLLSSGWKLPKFMMFTLVHLSCDLPPHAHGPLDSGCDATLWVTQQYIGNAKCRSWR